MMAALALATFASLLCWRVVDYCPPLPRPLALVLTLEPDASNGSDPLIVSGRTDAGDFLSIHFLDASTVRFAYDSWGVAAILSSPVAVPPNRRLRLEIEMPALDHLPGSEPTTPNRVRILCESVTVLDSPVHSYGREAAHFWFGENPIGGTACGTELRGTIRDGAGRILRGSAAENFTFRERITGWLRHHPGNVVLLLLLSVALVYGMYQLAILTGRKSVPRLASRHRWFLGTTVLCSLVFTWMVTYGSFQLRYAEAFGNFYDFQAQSFLEGRLDVPEAAVGGEAFEAKGKLYGYFGPTPALLRLPFNIAGIGFGQLSRLFMLLYFGASLTAAYLILCDAVRRTRPPGAPDSAAPPSPFATFILLASTGLGSTVFYLGSRGVIFHEAILAGIAFALWSTWCSLRHLYEPERRWCIGALVCGLLSLHCRPPTGLFALTLLGGIVLFHLLGQRRRGLYRSLAIIAGCAVGVLSLNGLGYLKFGVFEAAPLRLSRPYANPDRLAHIDGKSFHLVNLPYNFDNYVLRPNYRIDPGFPWFYIESRTPGRHFPKAKIDLPDRTLALPYAMPSLFGLATLGCLAALLRAPRLRWPIVALWAAVLPMTLALFAAVATAQRYTGDFCPFLIAAGAFGLAALEGGSRGRRLNWAARGVLSLATLTAIGVTFALTLHYQRETVWGVPEASRHSYQQFRYRVDTFFGHARAVPPIPSQPSTPVDP
jgi:hypothetical protein